jgi:hypothetical protein
MVAKILQRTKYLPALVFIFLLFSWPFEFGIVVDEAKQTALFVRDGNVNVWIDNYHPFQLKAGPLVLSGASAPTEYVR